MGNKQDFRRLLDYLVEKGESVQEAKADSARWSEWSRTLSSHENGKRHRQERADREAKQRAAQNQNAQQQK